MKTGQTNQLALFWWNLTWTIWKLLLLKGKVASIAHSTPTPKRIVFEMEKVINLGIPHVGELILESIDTPGLFHCTLVSETLKVLAENVLIKRWKGKMFQACQNGETKVVELLLERCNPEESELNIKDEDGWTAFFWACNKGHKDVVKLLLDSSERIELNARTNNGNTAFMTSCKNGHKNVVQLLLDYSERIELNKSNIKGNTAFMIACFRVHKDVVQLLLDLSDRIELNARKNNGRTAFMIACRSGNKDLVKLLLDYSEVIDINIPESFQLSEEIKTLLKMHSMTVQK